MNNLGDAGKNMRKLFQMGLSAINHVQHLETVEESEKALTEVKEASQNHYVWKMRVLYESGNINITGLDQSTFDHVMELMREKRRGLDKITRLTIFLRFAKEGVSQNSLAKESGFHQTTISRIIAEIIEDLVSVSKNYIVFPQTKREILALEKEFIEQIDGSGRPRNIPCFATLDGKHWDVEHPPHSGSLNMNYKGFFSFNSLFLASAKRRILYIQISELGCNSDAQMYRNGPLPDLLERAALVGGLRFLPNSRIVMPRFVLADNGFGLHKYVMQPYRNSHLTTENQAFNWKICGTRVNVENLFGVLSSKFQIFRRSLTLEPTRASSLIVACCVIHNIQIGPLKTDEVEDDNGSHPLLEDPYS